MDSEYILGGMGVWLFRFYKCILRFHVNLPSCKEWKFDTFPVIHTFVNCHVPTSMR